MKSVKKFIIYFPVMLVSLQVLVDLWALIDRESYLDAGFYLNTFLGTNILFAVFMVLFTFAFNFCSVSRFASIAELLFGIAWMVIQEDNLYNILFQVIVGVGSLYLTYRHFVKKFPLCRVSLVHKFFGAVFLTGSCTKGLDKFEKDIESTLIKMHHDRNNKSYS